MKMLQLNPSIPVMTPHGPGFAVGWIDYSQEHDTIWKCCITQTGDFWDLPQSQVRGIENITMGRPKTMGTAAARERSEPVKFAIKNDRGEEFVIEHWDKGVLPAYDIHGRAYEAFTSYLRGPDWEEYVQVSRMDAERSGNPIKYRHDANLAVLKVRGLVPETIRHLP